MPKKEIAQEYLDLMAETLGGEPEKALQTMLEEIEKAKLSEKAANAAKMALRLLSKYKEEEGIKQAVKVLVDAMGGYGSPEPEKKAEKKVKKEVSPAPKKEIKEAIKKAVPELAGDLEALLKAQDEKIQKAEEKAEKAEEQAVKAEQKATAERDLRLQREYLEKAQGYFLPIKAEELGAMLKRLSEVDEELSKKFDGLLGSTSTALEKSALMVEFGTSKRPEIRSATEELMAKANELIQKGEGKVSFGQAVVQLEQLDPDLYLRYMREARNQT